MSEKSYKILDKRISPEDIKKMSIEEMNQLSREIRKYLLETIYKTGGHLSSNLGVVELTIGLHYVFNSPYDKLVWDVGHQSYVHKILTGRMEELKTIRQYEGISGFPKRSESEHDIFDTGHSSTSISAALGFVAARNIKKEGNSVVAIIGDGALTAGVALEGLNNGANAKKNFIVILNDNQMSISKNVGGLAEYLDTIRTEELYKEIKNDVHRVLEKLPIIGQPISKAAKDIKKSIKQLVIPGMFFEEIGYTYLGPVDGHNISQVIKILKQAKKIEGPVLVHLRTTKGKGYHNAEKDPSGYHGMKPSMKRTNKSNLKKSNPTYSQILGKQLIKYCEEKKKIVGITAAMPDGTGLQEFAKKYPENFFDVGIAEQHGVTFATGLALAGIKPFVAIYSSFLQRAYDQVLHDVCIQNAPVVFLLDRSGIVGEDGETHQGVFDLSYLNHMPNMTVLAPSNGEIFIQMLDFSADYWDGPIAIRYPKGSVIDIPKDESFKYGKSEVIVEGSDLAIIGVGSMLQVALDIGDKLEKGITVIDAISIKPLDKKLLDEVAKNHNTIVIIEENVVIGSYGSEVLRYLSGKGYTGKVHIYGIDDIFVTHGPREQLLSDIGLESNKIIKDLSSKVESWQ